METASDACIRKLFSIFNYIVCRKQLLSVVCSTKLVNTSLSFANRLALNSRFAFRLVLIKLLSASGDGEIRTLDPLLARQVLSQLSYTPIGCGPPRLYGLSLLFDSVLSNQSAKPFFLSDLLGLSGLEPPTSRLSGVRSNRLSYKPFF